MIGPFAVAVMERFGLRRTVSVSLVILAAGVALTSLMWAHWQMMVLWGILVGSGTGMIAVVFGATIAERWFVSHRGLVLGILTASSATGQLISGSCQGHFLFVAPQRTVWSEPTSSHSVACGVPANADRRLFDGLLLVWVAVCSGGVPGRFHRIGIKGETSR